MLKCKKTKSIEIHVEDVNNQDEMRFHTRRLTNNNIPCLCRFDSVSEVLPEVAGENDSLSSTLKSNSFLSLKYRCVRCNGQIDMSSTCYYMLGETQPERFSCNLPPNDGCPFYSSVESWDSLK